MPSSSSMPHDNFVTLLGTKGGPAIRYNSSMPTSSLLMLEGQPIIIDCGLGITRALCDQAIALKDIRLIFITHLHSDHYLELGGLLHTAWTAGLCHEVEIWGPKGLETYWNAFCEAMKADIELRIEDEGRPDLRNLISVHIIEEGQFYTSPAFNVKALRVKHPPLTDCFALSFQNHAHHIVFSGDTAFYPPLAQFAQHADLLVHEAMLEEALPALCARVGNASEKLMQHLTRSHSTAKQAAQIAQMAQVKRLALHHLIPADDENYQESHWHEAVSPIWQEKLYIGKDGMKIML